jgi:3'5'-cyclic nucleotide phosphodiesterase/Adenylate and Guanylate cyclase catalytic domain
MNTSIIIRLIHSFRPLVACLHQTVNTASRMESNGEKNRIQVSQKTADLLEQAGKGHWLTARSDKIQAKGKGELQTYWCCPKSSGDASSSAMSLCDSNSPDQEDSPDGTEQQHLSVEWIVKVFQGLLQDVKRVQDESTVVADLESPIYGRPRDELTDALSLSSDRVAQSKASPPLDAAVSQELRAYIEEIANRYRSNPFHNMEHCSHVVMSTLKLLHQFSGSRGKKSKRALQIDPLTRLAIVFAALIHDVDHAGVSNAQLVLEGTAEAKAYAGQSVAEQNSITTAWTLLMEDSRFVHLRACIYSNEDELKQFREIVVNMVLATDLFDKDLQTMRNAQWEDVFGEYATCATTDQADNKRATIILQLIIQASDVSHTMQHFTVYKKWNMRLLEEMYQAYTSGRAEKDPTIGWYDGELWFFDNYVIPLALKLQRCGDFGVSADEFLDYAKDNRFEWERNGRAIVAEAQDRLRGGADISASPSRLEL